MTLKEFREQNDDLYPAAVEWILDGWGYSGDEEDITPLMFAAALEKEANSQDGYVARGESDASFPKRLRQLACELATTAIADMERKPEVK
jgi:hypothetical protein